MNKVTSASLRYPLSVFNKNLLSNEIHDTHEILEAHEIHEVHETIGLHEITNNTKYTKHMKHRDTTHIKSMKHMKSMNDMFPTHHRVGIKLVAVVEPKLLGQLKIDLWEGGKWGQRKYKKYIYI